MAPYLPWRRFAREIGGTGRLTAVVDDEGRPDPERVREVVNAITWRMIGRGEITPD